MSGYDLIDYDWVNQTYGNVDDYDNYDDDNYKQDGHYDVYVDNKLKISYNIYYGIYYGECLYYNDNDSIKIRSENYLTGFSRTTYYDDNGKKKYCVICTFNDGHEDKKIIHYQENEYNDEDKFETFELFLDSIQFHPTDENHTINMGTTIFHYGNDRISYREKDSMILSYYKNGYIKNNNILHYNTYKTKKMLFY